MDFVTATSWKNKKIRHQWQNNQEDISLSRKTGLDYPYEKSLNERSPMPIIGEYYQYFGSSNETNTHEEFYRVVDIARHWYDGRLAVFVTTDDFPNTTDTDYCWSMHPEMFLRLFKGKLT